MLPACMVTHFPAKLTIYQGSILVKIWTCHSDNIWFALLSIVARINFRLPKQRYLQVFHMFRNLLLVYFILILVTHIAFQFSSILLITTLTVSHSLLDILSAETVLHWFLSLWSAFEINIWYTIFIGKISFSVYSFSIQLRSLGQKEINYLALRDQKTVFTVKSDQRHI
jgi:hypothetical protein